MVAKEMTVEQAQAKIAEIDQQLEALRGTLAAAEQAAGAAWDDPKKLQAASNALITLRGRQNALEIARAHAVEVELPAVKKAALQREKEELASKRDTHIAAQRQITTEREQLRYKDAELEREQRLEGELADDIAQRIRQIDLELTTL